MVADGLSEKVAAGPGEAEPFGGGDAITGHRGRPLVLADPAEQM